MIPTLMQGKKVLNHGDFDSWEKITNGPVSNNGGWASFIVNPQEGDGMLTFIETATRKKIEIPRGYSQKFSADGKWAVALIKPLFKETRSAKINKKKGFELPQDSLVIVNLTTGKTEKIGNVISYGMGEKGGDWIAWLSSDTTMISPKGLKDEKAGRPLVVRNLASGQSKILNWVKDYVFSKDGTKLALTLKRLKGDTIATDGVGVIILPDTAFHLIDREKEFYGKPVFNEEGSALAYTASSDSTDTGTKKGALYLVMDFSATVLQSREIEISFAADDKTGMEESMDPVVSRNRERERKLRDGVEYAHKLFVNQYSQPLFSQDGDRLIVGVGRYVAPDDTTLVSFETPGLDIWRWDAPMTPPQELNRVRKLREQTYPVVITLSDMHQELMTSNPLVDVSAPDRWNGKWALLADKSEDIVSSQWDYQFPVELYVKNVGNGETRRIGKVWSGSYLFSPAGRYVVWFADREYHSFSIDDGNIRVIGKDIPYPLWDEDNDTPVKDDEPYGIATWTENDGRVLVYDRNDIWSVDPTGVEESLCLTAGEGRKRDLKIRYVNTDREKRYVSYGEKMLFSLFNYSDKRNGLATYTFKGRASVPVIDFLDGYTFTHVEKSRDADVYSWIQGNFSTSPNVYLSRDIEKGRSEKASDTNPQMSDYSWGTANLFRWTAYDGKSSDGVLYLPEGFSPDKEYPMLVYFYETYSQSLYKHYDMEPSWSWINFPFYVSRDYVVFVPDIHYTAGIPGECAYNYVCSGVEAVCRQYPNIDIKRVGIDGQSWGGYQTAYLVTRTDMFACAGSGAPVANMTSAFGGIRWESGDSRQGQYEQGQSRIGRNLWESTELYVANSPVFHANRVKTPLLIMHNDADGAVPWYQGIEMFMALRRLGKPVWMLQYNGEAHNLKERRNRKDITIRLQEFFDHYLKGSPMPEWMRNGIPAVRKGQEFGY